MKVKERFRLNTLCLTEKAAVRTALQIGIHLHRHEPFAKELRRALRHLWLGTMSRKDLQVSINCLAACALHLARAKEIPMQSRALEARVTASAEMMNALEKLKRIGNV